MESLGEYYGLLWREDAVRTELLELLDVLDPRSRTRAAPSQLPGEIPLTLHAHYSESSPHASIVSRRR